MSRDGVMTRFIQVALALAGWLIAAPGALGHSLKDVEGLLLRREPYVEMTDRRAPDFRLEDADGRPVGLADHRGKVVVLWFIYAGCPDVCPLQSQAIAAIQEKVNATPMRDLVSFVAITTDPARDLPEVLKGYGPAQGLDPVNWVFLTSGREQPTATRELARRYGLEFTLVDDGYQMHGIVTHLIDKSGNLRARYHGLKFNPTSFIMHLNALTNDDH